jgi:hypothetical protein
MTMTYYSLFMTSFLRSSLLAFPWYHQVRTKFIAKFDILVPVHFQVYRQTSTSTSGILARRTRLDQLPGLEFDTSKAS